MNLSYSEEYEAFRAEVRAFIEAHWPPRGAEAELPHSEQVLRFRERAIAQGYLARSIPLRYGGSEQAPDVLKATLIRDELRRAGAPGEVLGLGVNLLVPTLLTHGQEWQKQKFIGPTIRGQLRWCQGYSEPGSGSDLASLQTRAELRDGEWVINGQKIWTSGAQFADYMFCLCRSEPDMPKHAGISYLLIDMKQPGITIQPLKQMTGNSGFNQIFFSDARTPADWIVGKRGEGWLVSRTTLKHERNGLGNFDAAVAMLPRLVELARRTQRNGRPAIQDPEIRQRLVTIEGYMRSRLYSLYRRVSKEAKGQSAGPIELMDKLTRTEITQMAAKLAVDLIGDEALLPPPTGRPTEAGPVEDFSNRGWIGTYMQSLGTAIAAGSSNIQRNVIAERGLGLPRDYHASVAR